jgi:hypothetical protein
MPGSGLDRRQFIGSAAASAAFFALHDVPLVGGQLPLVPQDELKRPRLLSMELMSGAPMSAMKAFYGKTLDLRLLDERADRFSVEAGESKITFVMSTETVAGRAPFYHFAFNIPENKIRKALEWQRARTPMLAIPERNRAAGYPPEVVDYSHWNAHSVFFLDPAGNVLEYIARHDLENGDAGAFGWPDILYVSELALVVDAVAATAETVKRIASVPQYKGGDDQFTALGDEYGLLLLMKRGRVVDFTGNAEHGVRVYRTAVNVRGAKAQTHQIEPYPYQLKIEERCACG